MELLPPIKNGQASYIFNINLLDSTSNTGGGKAGLTNATSGLLISTIADNEAAATVYTGGSTIQTIAAIGTYAAPSANNCRFIQVDSTNHPGLYQIQLADARYAVASAKVLYCTISGAAGLVPRHFAIPLVLDDPYLAALTAAQIATAVWAYVVEGSFTAVQFLRGIASACLGKASGLATTTAVYRDVSDTKDRISATVDASGNRTAVTTDLT